MDDEYKDYIKNLAKDFVKSEKLDAILVKALNGYADKIKNKLRTKLQTKKLTEISKKIASTKIAKSYRAKLSQFELNIAIAREICSLTGAKDVYFKNIAKLLQDNGSALKIRDMYFYYCKFGSKFIGYYQVKKEGFVNEFVNTVFLNVSFKSTKFIDVKFRLTKFINAKYNDQHFKNLMARSPKLRTLKKDFKQQDEFILDNSKFKNAVFEDCYFYKIKINDTINFDTTVINKYPAPIFINSKFNNCDFILPLTSINLGTFTPSTAIRDKYYLPDLAVTENLTDHKYLDYYYTKEENVIKPKFIFEKTTFDNTLFTARPAAHAQGFHLDKNLFLECLFSTCILDIGEINNCLFKNTFFKGVIFKNIKFIKTIFINCFFRGCQFVSCHLGNQSFNEFDNCTLSKCTFTSCILCNYFDVKNVLIIRSNCEFNKCTFSDTLMKLMKVNFDSQYKVKSKQLKLTNCEFVCPSLTGTCFDNCNLEGSKFNARTTCVTSINWFGKSFLFTKNKPLIGSDKTSIINSSFAHLKVECIVKKIQILGTNQGFFTMRFTEYNSIDILPEILNEFLSPFDFFENIHDTIEGQKGFYQILPQTTFFNSNIKACNFQQAEGFQNFDFTQLEDKDLTATNFTAVDLTNSSFNGCKLVGTVFQVADVKGVDFRNCTVNNNTDFENAFNTEIVPHQKERDDGTRFVEDTKNLDTGRELQFGALQQQANETHARAQFVINNRNKLNDFYQENTCESLSDPKNLNNLKLDIHLVPITIFFNKLLEIVNKLKRNEHLSSIDKDYLLNNFSNSISNFVADRLEYTETEKTNLKQNIDRCVTREFVDILTSIKDPIRGGEDGKWSWLGMVYGSLIYLFSSTKLYLKIFMEYYFNEVFNAHGQGSMSCVLGMVERWVTIHSQATEAYIMTLVMEKSEMTNERIKTIKQLNDRVKDDKINNHFVDNFNNIKKINKQTSLQEDTESKIKRKLRKVKDLLEEINKNYDASEFEDLINSIDKELNTDLGEVFNKERAEGTILHIEATLENLREVEEERDPSSELYELIEKTLEEFTKLSSKKPDDVLDFDSRNNKFVCYRLLNLLKPNLTLPESPKEDIVFELDYNITPKMREEWHTSCKKKIADGEINSLDELSKDFVETIKIYILKDHGINQDKLEELLRDKDKKDTVKEKIELLVKHLEDTELPNLKIVIVSIYGDDISIDDLKNYFEGGRKKMKGKLKKLTMRQGKGIAKSLSLKRSKTLSRKTLSMRARSDSSVDYKNYQKSIEKALLEKFVNLSKDKLDSFINNTTIIETNIDKIVLKDNISSIKKIDNTKKPNILNHNILDKSYKEFIKQQYKKAKESFKMLLSNKSSKHKKMELKELSKKSSKKLKKTLKKENSFKNNLTTSRKSRSSKTNRKNKSE